ncbi:MAG: 3-hydroxybutyryl-CoA dehydrogenase, partial [Candidatus Kapabacteria bacterium]|nr:3-hydroxybutyryl-CoA dehydrogenase [Candidatus Kapabacteria bacterium]
MKNVVVIGAGTMGNGIAHVSAQFGHDVVIVDVNEAALERGKSTIEKNLARQVTKGSLSEEQKNETLGRITLSTNLEQAAANADIIIEAASENFEIKKKLFGIIDAASKPECILASNTSSISITEIAACTKRPDKVIGMHFFNPVPVMKLCELVRGQATSDETYATVRAMAVKLEKTPVEVQDYPGFISNRILM